MYDILVLSGGGDWGAFGAGVLKGWSRVHGPLAPPEFESYRKMHFPASGSSRYSRMREAGEGDRIQADEGWTKRVNRGTTAAPSQSYPPHSVQPDDGSTLAGLERL